MPSGTTVESSVAPVAAVKAPIRKDIQGLRALAVLLVVVYHAGVQRLSGGYVGVDVFFVISGFLITGQLLRTLDRDGSIRFGAFYAKRARRILPAALLVAVLTTIASWIWLPPLLMKEAWQGAVATALYVPNMLFAVQGTNYLSESTPSVFQHYWSLGIEEQFYLFWPAILALGFWIFRRKNRALLAMVLVLTLASFVLCVVVMDRSQPWAFFSLPTRAWELGAGALAAFLLRSDRAWLKHPALVFLAWIGLLSLVIIGLLFDSSTPFPGIYAALPVVATALLITGGGVQSRFSTGRMLNVGVLQFIGKISYSLYLVHWPLQVIPQAFAGATAPLPLFVRLLLGIASVPLAWLLYRWVEKPCLEYRPLAEARPRGTLWVAAAASVLVITVAFGAFTASNQIKLSTNQVASQGSIMAQPNGNPFVPSNLEPSLRQSSRDNPVIYSNGCHRSFGSTDSSGCRIGANASAPHIALFGDSHAASWYPAFERLAMQGLIRLDVNTKSSCHSVDVPNVLDGRVYTECQQWRDGVIQRLNAEQPDLVVLANFGSSQLVGGNENFATRWKSGLEKTTQSMLGVATAVIADVPNNGSTPAICLSAHLDSAAKCNSLRSESLDPQLIAVERSAAEATSAAYLDFTDFLCNQSICPAIVENKLVYRDAHHLTATFSRSMSDIIWKQIQPLLKGHVA